MNEILKALEAQGIDINGVPMPRGWRILVKDRARPETTKSGSIFIPDQAKDADETLNYIGQVVALGPAAYRHRKFLVHDGDSGRDQPQDPWCKPGDWVVFGRYAGQKCRIGDHSFRFVNDDEILGVAADPEALTVYV